jgi:hypothetical protein
MRRIIRGRRARPSSDQFGSPSLFTGRQLTAIVIAFMAAIVFMPVAASAAGSLVTIVDGSSNTRAKVDSTGALKVGGTVSVGGITREAATNQFKHFGNVAFTSCQRLGPAPPAGQAYVITQVNVDTYQGAPGSSSNFISIFADASCNEGVATVTPQTLGVTNLPLGPGVTTKTGMSVRSQSASLLAQVSAFGYQIAASGAASAPAPQSAPHR